MDRCNFSLDNPSFLPVHFLLYAAFTLQRLKAKGANFLNRKKAGEIPAFQFLSFV
jgi:hypothetical protein